MDFSKKIEISSFSHLTIFFQHCFTKEKKLVKWENDKIKIFLKNPNFEFSFLDNPAISGPGKCKIWNLGIKMSKTPKYCLWETIGTFYLCFQEISMKHTRSYWALCHVRFCPIINIHFSILCPIFANLPTCPKIGRHMWTVPKGNDT